MSNIENLDLLFVAWAFLFQVVLITHFSLRKWFFDTYILKFGWLVYALSIPAVVVSVLLLAGRKPWSLWIGGLIYLIWAIFGYSVEYVKRIRWRNPIRWPIFGPYVFLYLATIMFYWWPLALISKPLWYVFAILFIVSTVLNVSSHKGTKDLSQIESG